MHRSLTLTDPISLDASADLETVLAAWHGATMRLEQTHEALRGEVQRLTHELEIKNRELARQSRLADIGQMASHVAHEVRNSLVPVTLYLSLLRRRLTDDNGSREIVEKIAAGFTDLEATVNDLLQFTADRDPCWQRFEVRGLVEEVLASLAPQLAAQSIETIIDIPERQTLTADRDMLRRAVLNLSLNALDAMPDGGRLFITTYSGPEGLELEIADTRAGTFRTGPAPGLRAVLSPPRAMARAWGWRSSIESPKSTAATSPPPIAPKGARRSRSGFPSAVGRPPHEHQTTSKLAAVSRRRRAGRVLVVDDHLHARQSIADVLRHAGHQVECLASAVEALKLLERESFDVVITDLQMPGMSGLEFIHHLERRPHGAQVLMVTAHASVASAVDAMRHGAFDYIEKPFDVDQLEQLVARAIQHGRMLDRRPTVQPRGHLRRRSR